MTRGAAQATKAPVNETRFEVQMRVVIGGVIASPGVIFLMVMVLDLVNGLHLNGSMMLVSLLACLLGWRFANGCYDAYLVLRWGFALICVAATVLLVDMLEFGVDLLPNDVPFLRGKIGITFTVIFIVFSAATFWMLGSTRKTLGFEKPSKRR